MLEGHPAVREDSCADVIQDFVGSAEAGSLVKLDLLVVHVLQEPELDHAREERIQIVQNGINLELAELAALALDDFFEVLDEAFPRAEVRESLSCTFAGLQEDQVEAVASQMVSESLDALLRPSLDAL